MSKSITCEICNACFIVDAGCDYCDRLYTYYIELHGIFLELKEDAARKHFDESEVHKVFTDKELSDLWSVAVKKHILTPDSKARPNVKWDDKVTQWWYSNMNDMHDYSYAESFHNKMKAVREKHQRYFWQVAVDGDNGKWEDNSRFDKPTTYDDMVSGVKKWGWEKEHFPNAEKVGITAYGYNTLHDLNEHGQLENKPRVTKRFFMDVV